MKKHKKKIICIIILSILVLTIPYLIDFQFVVSYIEKKARRMYNVDISIEKTYWQWLPSPGISVKNAILENSQFCAEIDNITISPVFLSLLTGNIEIKNVKANSPKIRIKSLENLFKTTPVKKEVGNFPLLDITITNGELILPFDGYLKNLKGKIEPVNITKINLGLNTNTEKIKITTSLKTPYASNISTDMTISRNSVNDLPENLFWDIKSKAQNVDLSQVRNALLLLFKDDETVKEVFEDYILGGKLSKAGFLFKGKTSDFDDRGKIFMTAEVYDAKIHISGTKITLSEAKGSMVIKDAVLTGKNISAKLKNSFGKNGSLSLGLAEDDFGFNLNFDIDADLSELQGTIDEFIYDPDLKKQLAGIKNLTGRTSLNLKLMDNTTDINTYISVPALSGKFYYDFLNRDITIHNGGLNISPESVSWNNLTCDIGPNSITKASGSIIPENDFLFDLTGEKAKLNSDDIYKILSSWPKVEEKISKVVKGIDGEIKLSDFKLSGPVKKPAEIMYDLNLSSEALTISSAILPKPVTLTFNSENISNEKIILNQIKAKLNDSVLLVSTNLDHNLLSQLTGSIIINGVADKELTPWLREKGWLSDSLLPKLPCNLSPLSISLTEKDITITGNLVHEGIINTIVDIKVEENNRFKGVVEVLAGKENALIRLNYPEKPNNKKIAVSFNGDISRNTITKVIDNDWLPGDNLKGRFNLLYTDEKTEAISMTGSADINNFNLKLGKSGALLLDNIKITGKNDYADLDLGDLTIICPDSLKSVIKENPVVSELNSRLYFQHNEAALLKIFSGNTCGVNVTGDINIPSKKLNFNLTAGKEKRLTFDELFSCLGIKQIIISGGVSIDANIKGTNKDISGSRIKLKAVDGVVKKANLLAKILSLIDLTELFEKNPVKKLMASGYRYDSIEIDAVVIGNKLHIVRAVVYGSGLNLYVTGDIDLKTMALDMVALASPFTTIDNIIKNLPVIGQKIGGKGKSITSVPLKIEGKLGNPEIRFMPKRLTDVSSDIINTFIKTFKIPFEFSHKLVTPKKKKQKKR